MGEVGARDQEDAIAGGAELGQQTAEPCARVGVGPQSRADGEWHDPHPGTGSQQQRQLDLEGVLDEMGIVVGRERRAQAGDPQRQVAVHRHFPERRPPRPAGPDPDAGGRGLMIRAGEHDRGGGDLAGELPRQGRDGARVDQPCVRNQPADAPDSRPGRQAARRTRHRQAARRTRHRREACRRACPGAPARRGRRCPPPRSGVGVAAAPRAANVAAHRSGAAPGVAPRRSRPRLPLAPFGQPDARQRVAAARAPAIDQCRSHSHEPVPPDQRLAAFGAAECPRRRRRGCPSRRGAAPRPSQPRPPAG